MSFGVTFKTVTRIDAETDFRTGLSIGMHINALDDLDQRINEFEQERGYIQADFAPLIEISFTISEDMNALIDTMIFSQLMRSLNKTEFEWLPNLGRYRI